MSREAMQLALEALESDPLSHAGLVSKKQAITALRKALETDKQWVGLTDEEISEIEDEYIVDYRIPAGSAWNFAKDLEAKLKEKNGG